jgi:hypothetical protein
LVDSDPFLAFFPEGKEAQGSLKYASIARPYTGLGWIDPDRPIYPFMLAGTRLPIG